MLIGSPIHKLCVLLTAIAAAIGSAACGGSNETIAAPPEPPAVTQKPSAPAETSPVESPVAAAAEEPAHAEEPAAQSQEKPLLEVALNEQLGRKILVDARGLTLYLFDWDTDAGGQSQCYDDPTYHCSRIWPPLLTIGEPRAGKGVASSLLGTQEREDGTIQVTYNGHPVYYFAGFAPTPADTPARETSTARPSSPSGGCSRRRARRSRYLLKAEPSSRSRIQAVSRPDR